MADQVSGSRLRRLGQLAWMSRRAIPLAVTRFRGRNGAAGDELDPAHVAAAEEMLGTLGNLKGLALKMGQMLSYMDGALPAEAEPAFRRVLAKLQRDAPRLPWGAARKVLEQDLGDLQAHFAQLEEEPFAAASIGQVHRGQLLDGTAVAVKVQYPGIREAIEADLGNLALFAGLARPMLGAFGAASSIEFARSTIEEVRARMLEEVDYEHEARMQVLFHQRFAGVPDLQIPKVHFEHSGPKVLTTELVAGQPLEEAARADDELRGRWARALTRAVTDQLYVHGLFNGDPHPGNYLFRSDGTVVLLDFGCIKEVTPRMQADMRRYLRAAIVAQRTGRAEDWAAFDDAVRHAFNLREADPAVFRLYRDMLVYVLRPVLVDEPFAFTPEYTAGVNDLVMEGKRQMLFADGRKIPRIPKIPADYTFIHRLQWGFYSVLTALRATVNWHAMLPEELRARP